MKIAFYCCGSDIVEDVEKLNDWNKMGKDEEVHLILC